MIATTMYMTPPAPPVPKVLPMAEARLCLTPPDACGTERLDGAWWPRSRDLCRELPALIAALDPRVGRISRVTVDSTRWPEPPRRVAVVGRTIDVGWFPAGRNRIEICVLSNDAGRWDLLVVPPEYEFAESELPAAAAGHLDRHVAEIWLSGVTDRAAAGRQAGESVWESEGGRSLGREGETPVERHERYAADAPAPRTPHHGDAMNARRLPPAPRTPSSGTRQSRSRRSATMYSDQPMPPPGIADVRVIAATPEVARQVTEALRRCFTGTEQRSYPTGHDGGTRLHLTVDTTTRAPEPPQPLRPWLVTSHSTGGNGPCIEEV